MTLSNKVNRKLQELIDQVIARLQGGADTLDQGHILRAFQFSKEELGDAPTGPKGPSYQEMLNSLFDSIRKEVGDADNKKEAYVKELGVHRKKIDGEVEKNAAELAKLEKEEKSKITTEGLHEGFSTSVSLPWDFRADDSMSRSHLRNRPLPLPKIPKQNRNKSYKRSKFSILIRPAKMINSYQSRQVRKPIPKTLMRIYLKRTKSTLQISARSSEKSRSTT